mmetsp:Transcript_3721/g.9387  ORF Transcript_3721/g.9387 Transcript_3721/m.9387 type:complete len:98 (-) Transcript_3721:257-550(-)
MKLQSVCWLVFTVLLLFVVVAQELPDDGTDASSQRIEGETLTLEDALGLIQNVPSGGLGALLPENVTQFLGNITIVNFTLTEDGSFSGTVADPSGGE